jgi:hypothetical protein
MHRGDLADAEGHAKDGLPFFEQTRQLAAAYARMKPSAAAHARLHHSMALLAAALAENHRYDDALAVLREGEPIIDALLAAEPDNPNYIRQKMEAANYEAYVYDNEEGNSLHKPLEAVAAGKRYLAMAQRLADADPHNASARLSMAIANFLLSYPLGEIDPAESLRAAERSIQIFDESLAGNPNSRLLISRRARALRHLAYALNRNHRLGDARAAAAQAVQIQQKLLADTPSDGSEREQLSRSQNVLAALSK